MIKKKEKCLKLNKNELKNYKNANKKKIKKEFAMNKQSQQSYIKNIKQI